MAKSLNKKILNILALILILAPLFILVEPTWGQSTFEEISGLNTTADQAGFQTGSSAATVDNLVARTIYVILGLIGVIFLGLMIFGGVTWMIAQGNEQKVTRAKDILLNALIGIVITLSAYAISYFIINYFT